MVGDGLIIGSSIPIAGTVEKRSDTTHSVHTPQPVNKDIQEPKQSYEAARERAKLDEETLQQGIENLNKNIRVFNSKVSFSIDKNTGRTIIRVSDRETNEVIREIPPEDFLKIASKLSELMGILIDHKI